MISLLAKTRQLNRLLQEAAGQSINFTDMANVLRDTMGANVYVLSYHGALLAYATAEPGLVIESLLDQDEKLLTQHNRQLLRFDQTSSNGEDDHPDANMLANLSALFRQKHVTIIPIIGGCERMGTLLLTRAEQPFIEADFVLAEYGATVIGMELLKEQSIETEAYARNRANIQVAVGSLSYSEFEAVQHIFAELENKQEGTLVASKIADRVGITRSVIVNALRKLESASVIETKSLGMKGTYIKILNPLLLDEFF